MNFYLDANANSRLRPEAAFAMAQFADSSLQRNYSNPSSVHQLGQKARAELRRAKEDILHFLKAGQESLQAELVLTSGATESCNAMIQGFVQSALAPGEILASAIEHPCVMEPLRLLESQGWKLKLLAPDKSGRVQLEQVLAALGPRTSLVCLMAANNETGALQPLEEVARAIRTQGLRIPIVCDFVQALAKSSISIASMLEAGINALAFSGHKLGAAAGIGGLLVAQSEDCCFQFSPLLRGGPQENRWRAGTENLCGALSLAAVCRYLSENSESEQQRIRQLREILWSKLESLVSGIHRLTPFDRKKEQMANSNTLLIRVEGCRGDDLVAALDLAGVCVSSGAACASGKLDVSATLLAMGYTRPEAKEVIRLSLDWDSSEKEILSVSKIISKTIEQMRTSLIDKPLEVKRALA